MHAQVSRSLVQALVTGPKQRIFRQTNGGEQMGVGVPDSPAVEFVPIDHQQNFVVGGDLRFRQIAEQGKMQISMQVGGCRGPTEETI